MPKTIVCDLESTGLLPYKMVHGKRKGSMRKEELSYKDHYNEYPYIVSLAWKVDDEETKEYIIHQEGRKIPQDSIDIHGITDEMAKEDGCDLHAVLQDMIHACENAEIIVGHGLYFNTSIIKANILREIDKGRLAKSHYDKMTEILHKDKRIDTMRSSAKMMRKWPTLTELHMKIFRTGFDAHSAKEDVEANYRVYQWLLAKKIVPTWEKLQEKANEKKESSNAKRN